MPLPKVRNAVGWRRALHAAIAGEAEELAAYMCHLIGGKTVKEAEQLLSTPIQSNDVPGGR